MLYLSVVLLVYIALAQTAILLLAFAINTNLQLIVGNVTEFLWRAGYARGDIGFPDNERGGTNPGLPRNEGR